MTSTSGPHSAGAADFWDTVHRAPSTAATRPNPVLAQVAGAVDPGDALDLGCGPGGDATWLAERGWRVTAADISAIAVARLRARAADLGLSGRLAVEQHDLTATFPAGVFDLVSAQYLQSPFPLHRSRVLRSAAHALRPGGLLLVVDHGSAAPWSWDQGPGARFPGPDEVAAELDLDPAGWSVLRADAPSRVATGPDGRTATVVDHVLLLQRTTDGVAA
jgi:SAM-dependent methyltransferase